MTKRLVSLLILLPIVGALFVNAFATEPRVASLQDARVKFDAIRPVKVVLPGSVTADTDVQIEIDMDGVATSDQSVLVTSGDGGAFTNLPAQAVVLAGTSSVTITAHVRAGYSGGVSIYAAANGTVVHSTLAVVAVK